MRRRRSRWSLCPFGLSSLLQEGLLRMGCAGHFKCRSARPMFCAHLIDGALVRSALSPNEFRDLFMGDVTAEKG